MTTRVYLLKRPRVLPADKAKFEKVRQDAIAKGASEKEARAKARKAAATYYWVLRWTGTNGRQQYESLDRCDRMTKTDAKNSRQQKELAFGRGDFPVDKPKGITLAEFKLVYETRRRQGDTGRGYLRSAPKLRESTIAEHLMTLRYMLNHFGDDFRIASITLNDAIDWVDNLEAGRLSQARKQSKRVYTITEQTVRKHIRNAKAIFNWAKIINYVHSNPFGNFDGKPLPSDANAEVTIADVEKILAATDDKGWRALFGLCRFAGLRRGEAIALPWSGMETDKHGERHWVGVDWETRRIHLVAEKTRMARVVPICPRLYEILMDAYTDAPEGSKTVCGLSENNLTRNAQAIVRAAGVTPWPKLYQAMRSSCKNDWKTAGVAEATYCAWMGHSRTVSRGHYVAPTDSEFAAVIGEPAK